MTDSSLGEKQVCPQCGTRFYDLNRDPIVCPCPERLSFAPRAHLPPRFPDSHGGGRDSRAVKRSESPPAEEAEVESDKDDDDDEDDASDAFLPDDDSEEGSGDVSDIVAGKVDGETEEDS